MSPEDDDPAERPVAAWTVPDDPRDLHRDVRALRREERTARRRQRLRRLVLTRRWERYGISGPVVAGVLVLVAGVASLPLLLLPDLGEERPGAAPLADPVVAPGQVGGLLPDGPVRTPAGDTTVRRLARPGVLVLTPVPCDCAGVLQEVVGAGLAVTRDVRLLSSAVQDPTGAGVTALRSAVDGDPTSGVDLEGVLADSYAAVGVTVVLVAPDGIVLHVVRDVREGQGLGPELGDLRSRSR